MHDSIDHSYTFIFMPALPLKRVVQAAVLRGLEIPHDCYHHR